MCAFLARAPPWARNLKRFIIIILLLYGTVVECPDVTKISLHNPNNRIDLVEDMILLQTGDEKYRVDPITFDKIVLSSKTTPRMVSLKKSQNNHNLPTAFHQFCGGECKYQCLDYHDDSQLCFFNAILPGCPTKDYLGTENRQDCNESAPMVLLNNKDHSKNLALKLDCQSTRWEKTQPYTKLTFFMQNANNNSIDGELHILFEALILDGYTTYGICRYTITEIIGAFNNTNFMIGVKDQDTNTWKDVPKNEFTSTSYKEGFIFDYPPKRTVYDEEYRNHEAITHCVKATLPGLDHNTTSFYCSISNNKIMQIVPETNETIDLDYDIEGKTIQLEIWKEEILLILTKTNLYKRPLYNCTATSCAGCTRQGPYCFWNEKQKNCDGSIDFEHIKKLRQKGDITRNCSSEFDHEISNDPDSKNDSSNLILIFTLIIIFIILVLVILLFVLYYCRNYWCKDCWQHIARPSSFNPNLCANNPPRIDFNNKVMFEKLDGENCTVVISSGIGANRNNLTRENAAENRTGHNQDQNTPLMADLGENQNGSRAEVNGLPINGQVTNVAHTSSFLKENENGNSRITESSESIYEEIKDNPGESFSTPLENVIDQNSHFVIDADVHDENQNAQNGSLLTNQNGSLLTNQN